MASGDVNHVDREGLMKKLEELEISTTTKEHPAAFTVEEMMEHMADVPGLFAKNLFMYDKKKKGLWLLSARHDVDVKLAELSKAVSAPGGLRLAGDDKLEAALGVRGGSVTAFALINDKEHKVKFLLDKGLMDEEKGPINFHPMINTAMTSISAPDLKKFLAATGHTPILVDLD